MTAPDWRAAARPGVRVVADDTILVELEDGRRHHVRVVDQGAGWALAGRSADAAALAAAGLDAPALWARNRHLDLVGYAVGLDRVASVTTWLPHAGITAEEFTAVAREVATEADRLEFYCSGQDLL